MARDITSKNIDGITDLVVVAPIKDGFIHAYENVTYATRLKIVAEALHRIRVSAREHEFTVPFSDTTERILTLLDFRVGVLDQDTFNLVVQPGGNKPQWKATRYLYLTATFDGAWEPYMRLIWKPLGSFLDLLFCNCDGYVTAGDHDFPAYAQWVRDHQVDSAIFYSTTGLTVKDSLYLNALDRLMREPDKTDLDAVRMTMPNPEKTAGNIRQAAANAADAADAPDPGPMAKIHELALEALTVLFRLADFYPPGWLTRDDQQLMDEGKYLARVAHELLDGWDDSRLLKTTVAAYKEPLEWYRTAKMRLTQDPPATDSTMPTTVDPPFKAIEVQGGMLASQGNSERSVRHGALLLMTIERGAGARAFVKGQRYHFAEGDGAEDDKGFFRTIAFTASGLERMGVDREIVRLFPREFCEGMATRAGLIGDVRENHPRRWQLPERNWPPLVEGEAPRPRVDPSEVDIVIQLRYAPATAEGDHAAAVHQEIERIATAAAASGVVLAGYEFMENYYDAETRTTDHFGFRDGVSQPTVLTAPTEEKAQGQIDKNQVRLGELLCGYRNDRGDFATGPGDYGNQPDWRHKLLAEAAALQKDGSYLVVRKLEQHDDIFTDFLTKQAEKAGMDKDALAARLVGRTPDGKPLVSPRPGGSGDDNDFNYNDDAEGRQCPLAAHIRRANPRKEFQKRPSPRIVRRGMAFGKPRDQDPDGKRGLMFMCYNASIAEQYETIQRWINGGNSTDVSSGQNDPLMGVGPKTGDRVFRFENDKNEMVRVSLSRGDDPEKPQAFVSLHWGMYLFVPSRSAIDTLCSLRGEWLDLDKMLESQGQEAIELIESLPDDQKRSAWKRLLEDIDAKDPAGLDQMPHIWSAIRWYRGGSYRIDTCTDTGADGKQLPPTVLTASTKQAYAVLCDWKTFSVEEQLSRITKTSGSIYVTQQPDDRYEDPDLHHESNYRQESLGTNEILFDYGEEQGFDIGYAAGRQVLAFARAGAAAIHHDYYKLELRRQYLMPALGLVCTKWFGIPDWDPFKYGPGQNEQSRADRAAAIMANGGWNWDRATDDPPDPMKPPRKAQCPGDCLAPSRGAFYPRPTETITWFANDHGQAIRKAGEVFVDRYLDTNTEPPGYLPKEMFKLFQQGKLNKDGFARNLIGIMVGAMPPMDGNLRGVLVEWLGQKTLWRHQAALLRAQATQPGFAAANAVLRTPMSRAMCKRPAPDLIYRKAMHDTVLKAAGADGAKDVQIKKDDQVVISLVSVAQRSLRNANTDDVSIVFGGKRECPWQGEYRKDAEENTIPPELPVHACPAQKMAMGAMMGILAALLKAGRIEALPASLIVKVSDWPPA